MVVPLTNLPLLGRSPVIGIYSIKLISSSKGISFDFAIIKWAMRSGRKIPLEEVLDDNNDNGYGELILHKCNNKKISSGN